MKHLIQFVLGIAVLTSLTGCMYPDERLAKNQVPYDSQIQSVQMAVDQFKEENNGILPIKTKDQETPIYLKYPIDFNKISPRYIPEPPGSAYESGGIFQYVLVDAETNPTVKLIDLRSVEVIRELKLRMRMYLDGNAYLPFAERIANGYFLLDYEKLGYSEPPYVESPFSGKNLMVIVDGEGEVFIDYSPDLFEFLKEHEHSYSTGDDIRSILVEHTSFVPAFSVPYTVENNEPVFVEN